MKSSLIKLHVAVFLWGFTGVLGRLISLNEGLLVWYRLLITIISLFFLLWHQNMLHKVSFKTLIKFFGVGAIIAFHWVCFYGSIKYANISIALVCLSSAGLFTAILEPIAMKYAVNSIEILLGLIAIIGIYLIFHFDSRYRTGIVIGLIASFLSVLFTILNKKIVKANFNPTIIMFYELTGGWLVLTLVMPLYIYLFPTKNIIPSFQDMGWLVLLSWFCTILAMNLSLQALKKVSAFTQNLTLNLEPVYGIVLAFIVYKENKFLSEWFYYGFILIIVAVVLQTFRIIKYKRV